MDVVRKRLGATDGRVTMPGGTTHYIFGFTDLTDVPENEIFDKRGSATLPAPLLECYEGDEVYLTLTNIGLPVRPDLDDSHTVHWHGFPNQLAWYDGVPESSQAIPVGRNFDYYYQPLNPGTYMYHCHFDPVGHVQMGMIAPLIVRPNLDRTLPGRHFVFNDLATEYQVEQIILLTELDSPIHRLIAEVQEPDWTEYKPDYWLINGRSYPDSMKPNHDNDRPLQPYSSKIEANPGDTILLRFINLGFEQHTIEILGATMKVVGLDARPLKQPLGPDLSYQTNVVHIGEGQTMEVLVTVHTPGTFPLVNRSYHRDGNAGNWPGGMITEILVAGSQPVIGQWTVPSYFEIFRLPLPPGWIDYGQRAIIRYRR